MWPFDKKTVPDDDKWAEINGMIVKLMSENKMDEAFEVAQELFRYSKECYGKAHGNTATALNNLGYLSIMRKELEKAESYLLMALQVTEKAYGKDSKEVAVVDMNLAKLYVAKAREIQMLEHTFEQFEAVEEEAVARIGRRKQA